MTQITDPKSEAFSKLSEISTVSVGDDSMTVEVYQQRPEVLTLEDKLLVTFRLDDHIPRYAMDNEIKGSETRMVIDLWGEDSVWVSQLAVDVEEKMRELDYHMKFNTDLADPDVDVFHKSTLFYRA